MPAPAPCARMATAPASGAAGQSPGTFRPSTSKLRLSVSRSAIGWRGLEEIRHDIGDYGRGARMPPMTVRTLYLGTSGFAYDEWKGPFYPLGLKQREMLPFYASRFPSVEINYTFRQQPAE